MAVDLPSDFNDLKALKREIEILREELTPTIISDNLDATAFGFGSSSSSSPVITGNTTYDPREVTESSNAIDIIGTSMIVTKGSGNPDVNTLSGTSHNGQVVILKPKEGKTLTLSTGGNIDISSNQTIADNEFAILKYYEDASNKYLVISGGGSGASLSGTNQWTGVNTFANAVSFTGATTTIGDASADLFTVYATPTFHQPLAMSSKKITSVADPTSAQDVATKAYVDSTAGGANVNLSNLVSNTAINEHLLPSTSGNKNLGSTSKEWATLYLSSGLYFGADQNSSTLNHSSGLLFNISDDNDWYEFQIDSDRKLSVKDNLIVTGTDLDPETDETYDLGSSNYKWNHIWGKELEGVDTIDFSATNTSIIGSSGNLQHNAGAQHSFAVAGSVELQLSADGLYLGSNSTPSSLLNGMIWNDGTNIYVRTNGATKNMSDIGSGGGSGANTSLSNLNSTGEAKFAKLSSHNTWSGNQTMNGTFQTKTTTKLGDSSSDDIQVQGKLNFVNNFTTSFLATHPSVSGYITIKTSGGDKNIWVS